jgi:hypothetical protein
MQYTGSIKKRSDIIKYIRTDIRTIIDQSENVATLAFIRTRSEARDETKYGAVAGWQRSLQRQLSNGVIPSREYS